MPSKKCQKIKVKRWDRDNKRSQVLSLKWISATSPLPNSFQNDCSILILKKDVIILNIALFILTEACDLKLLSENKMIERNKLFQEVFLPT